MRPAAAFMPGPGVAPALPERRFFTGPAGRLDARLHGPAAGPPVLLLHPHPLLGGTMGSRLVHDAAVALGESGWRAVRFDFRGVGRSEGRYGDGTGEVEDAAAVFDRLEDESGQPPAVVGHSFGAAVACRLATVRRPAALVMAAAPVAVAGSLLRSLDDAPRAAGPAWLVAGTRDPHAPRDGTEAIAAAFRPPATVSWVEGAGHFLDRAEAAAATAAIQAALCLRA